MIAVLRSALFLLLATLITAPFGLLITLAVVLPMRSRFALIAAWRRLFMALCAGVLGIRYRQLADGEFNHTSALVLLDADGRVAARTEIIGSKPDPAFVASVRKAVGP